MALSALWPFKRPFYARYGWATCSRGVAHELSPDALSFTRDHRHGEFVQLDADDWARTAAVHDAHGAGYELTMDRTEEWWRKRVFAGWDDDPFVYGWERDGDLAAYLTYSIESDDDTTLQVRDWAFADHDARLAALRFLADHDSQVEDVSVWTQPSEDLLGLVPDDDDVDAELGLGPMFRLVDVADALEALSFPASVNGNVVLDVDDPLVDWNDATFRVTVAAGEAAVDRCDDENTTLDVDAELGIGALSQLYVGYRSAEELATVRDIEGDSDCIAFLTEAFPERATFLREGF